MSGISAILTDVLADAASPGLAMEPARLLTALRAEAEPLTALARMESGSPLLDAIEQDFGFIRLIRITGQSPGEDKRGKWTALVRWLIHSLRDWTKAEDEQFVTLAALLVAAQFCGDREGVWRWLPSDSAPKQEFIEIVGRLIAERKVQYSSRGIGPVPIWEIELVEGFQQADAKGDWVKIAEQWPVLEQATWHDFVFAELVRCLSCYGFDELVRAADALPQTPTVMSIASLLSEGQRVGLALASGTARVRFCCAYATLTCKPQCRNLAPDNEEAFCALLSKVAAEPDEWRSWMTAFNAYPVRYPALYEALGKALAASPPDAADAFIDSVRLHTLPAIPRPGIGPNMNRPLVAVSLRIFAQRACPEQRKAVWTRAFKRWHDWNFDKGVQEAHLLDIQYSELDFAVVSYAVEGLSAAERDSAITSIRGQLEQVEFAWHLTETDCITAWNRLLSVFQPYAHAMMVTSQGEDALATTRIYWPFDMSKSLYHHIMFRVNPASFGSGMRCDRSQQPTQDLS